MPNILALLDIDGETPLPPEKRSGITQPVSEVSLVYSNESGDGEGEFVIRNVDSNNVALQVNIITVEYPYDADSGTQLDQQFSYEEPETGTTSEYLNTLVIPEIGPGKFVRVRRRVLANADSSTSVHYGNFRVSYLRSSAA